MTKACPQILLGWSSANPSCQGWHFYSHEKSPNRLKSKLHDSPNVRRRERRLSRRGTLQAPCGNRNTIGFGAVQGARGCTFWGSKASFRSLRLSVPSSIAVRKPSGLLGNDEPFGMGKAETMMSLIMSVLKSHLLCTFSCHTQIEI